MTNRNSQSGNVLFFILIAIALLGALTATLNRSSNNTNDTGSHEQRQIQANEILTYAKSIETAVQNLRARGCGENEIAFWHDSNGDGVEGNPDANRNSYAPTDHSCHIFEPEGAGMTFVTVPDNYLDSFFNASFAFGNYNYGANSSFPGVGRTGNCSVSECKELTMVLYHIKKELCLQINTALGIENPSGDAPFERTPLGNWGVAHFQGTYPSSTNGVDNGVYGAKTLCLKHENGSGDELYSFYHILLAR